MFLMAFYVYLYGQLFLVVVSCRLLYPVGMHVLFVLRTSTAKSVWSISSLVHLFFIQS
jgi:hypothetical protein